MATSPQFDFQREEVYRWESNFEATKRAVLSEKDFKTLTQIVCRAYGVKRPFMGIMKSKTDAAHCYDSGEIYFDKDFRSAWIVLHELAHYILNEYGYIRDHHSPRWLGLFLFILDTFSVVPLNATVPSARQSNLKFRRPALCSPLRLTRYLAKPR